MGYGTETQAVGRLSGAKGAPVPDTLPAAIEEIGPELQRLENLLSSLGSIADRLCGSRPSDAGAPTEPAPPHSMIDSLQRKRRLMANLITGCEQERDRIAQALGG